MARGDIPLPPSSVTGELGQWLQGVVWNYLTNQPRLSVFSGPTPNSNLTGLAGDIAVNIGSASTDTRAWIKGGSTTEPSTTGWVALRTSA